MCIYFYKYKVRYNQNYLYMLIQILKVGYTQNYMYILIQIQGKIQPELSVNVYTDT